ncbi:hypothetical protein IFM89_033130 [Coptis chinensis]|uniref:Uncharacterized protein n=1 Tax=Coptis chinensis TaxID=261450 RepID=A0A835HIG1_9MAGN|nr:hypothetical protein IFM89_033130 [Coptis chinensis]
MVTLIKRLLRKTPGVSGLSSTGASAVSGFFASACSLPFDYVKSQIQKMQPNAIGKYPYNGSLDCVLKTWKAGGALKFYTGFPVYRVKIAHYGKDFIFNYGGLSVAFVFVTNWDSDCMSSIFSRVQKLKGQFGNLYVIITLPTTEQNDSFVRNYFKYGMEIGRPTFVPIQDLEMGFEKIVKIAHARGGNYIIWRLLNESLLLILHLKITK